MAEAADTSAQAAAVRPVEAFDLVHPAVPAGAFDGGRGPGLEGLRVLHVSDLHVRKHRPMGGKFRVLVRAIDESRPDLVAITGDCMDEPGQENEALAALRDLSRAWSGGGIKPPALGAWMVLGNHDSAEFASRAEEVLGPLGIRLLRNEGVALPTNAARSVVQDGPPKLRLVGLSWPEDALAAAVGMSDRSGAIGSAPPPADGPAAVFTLVLAHMPSSIFTAADMGWPVVLAGHTHAGQIRLSPSFAPHTSSDVPVDLASGMLRLGSTLCCVSRGIGDGMVEGLRINCPWQAPLYTLRHGPLPALPAGAVPQSVYQMVGW